MLQVVGSTGVIWIATAVEELLGVVACAEPPFGVGEFWGSLRQHPYDGVLRGALRFGPFA